MVLGQEMLKYGAICESLWSVIGKVRRLNSNDKVVLYHKARAVEIETKWMSQYFKIQTFTSLYHLKLRLLCTLTHTHGYGLYIDLVIQVHDI